MKHRLCAFLSLLFFAFTGVTPIFAESEEATVIADEQSTEKIISNTIAEPATENQTISTSDSEPQSETSESETTPSENINEETTAEPDSQTLGLSNAQAASAMSRKPLALKTIILPKALSAVFTS